MSKITFRADDELIEELETFDASKSEVMRRALRAFLDAHDDADDAENDVSENGVNDDESVVNARTVEDTVVDIVDERVAELLGERATSRDRVRKRDREPRDVNVNITLDGDSTVSTDADADARKTASEEHDDASDTGRTTCPQCGENVGNDDVYCPNCGTKSSHRVFCECGDEIRSDWAFCPSCGRRTPAADVLDGP